MANVVVNAYGNFLVNLMTGNIPSLDLGSTVVRCALMDQNHTFNQDHVYWSQVKSNEVTDVDYSAKDLANKEVEFVKNIGKVFFKASRVNYGDTVTISARHLVMYVVGDNDSSSPLILSVNFGENKSSLDGRFHINWHSDGIFSISV